MSTPTSAEAIVLVGGQGSRLRPLTLTTPKPMLPCAGVPFLTHQLLRLAEVGVKHVVLATSYRPEVFVDHYGDGGTLGLAIDYVTEVEPMGTGGGIRNVADRLTGAPDDPVIVLNGDVLSGHDLTAQLEVHRAGAAAVTLHLVGVEDPRAFGCVPTDRDGRVHAFLEKTPAPVTDQINAGCYIFRREVIDAIPAGRPVSVERDTFPGLLAADAMVLGYREDAYWLDVGTPAAFVRGSADLVRGVLRSPAVADHGEALVLDGALVAEDALLTGGSTVGAGCVIGSGAVVEGSVLFDDVWIAAGARISGSVIGAGARVGERSSVRDAVLGDRALVGADNEVAEGARVWTSAVLPDATIRFSPGS
ncbi:MAG TPA: NDP-sugar synthase [Sporichthya sp.]|nr:NDP-sugar synthase [Sporichthya sp.]